MMTQILIYILIGMSAVSLLTAVASLFKVKVWLQTKTPRAQLMRFAFMNYKGDRTVPEAHLLGRAKGVPVGRVAMGEKDDNAYVEMLTSDFEDDSVRPQYRGVGYIAQDGLIYRSMGRNRKPEVVGYTARPSAPNVPAVVGERTWKSLWLRSTLYAYLGKPDDKPSVDSQKKDGGMKPDDKKKDAKKKGGNKRIEKPPFALATYKSFHRSKHDAMPPEARGAAYALFFGLYNKTDYQEYYESPAYGWKDTALLSAFIYAVLYVLWYTICVKVFGRHFIGFHFWQAPLLYSLYFPLWTIVRAVKIECVENSNTIQPKIDLFNKIVGQRGYDILILLCCTVVLAFTGTYYRFDFAALALVVMSGVSINMLMRSNWARWNIRQPFADENEYAADDMYSDLKNPEGEIARNYEWNLDSDEVKDVKGELTLYFDKQYVDDLRFCNPFYSQRSDKTVGQNVKDMFHYMHEHYSVTARLRYLVSELKRISEQNGLFKIEDQMQFALDFVQEPNIRFTMNRDSKAINQFEYYIRFPDEVLFDKEADSNSKALLAAMLFHFMGHNVLFLYSHIQKHGAIGIEIHDEWIEDNRIFGRNAEEITFLHNGRRYVFCETTGDTFRIGGTMQGMRHEDFDEHVELPVFQIDGEDTNEERVTCLYNWDLDPRFGKLHGCYTLEFKTEDIEQLREENPFNTYGQQGDTHTYDGNIKDMFARITKENGMAHILQIADYIKSTVEEAGLTELALIQFALDFVQEPNIRYVVDEQSHSINFANEYMRFPDEVLFDKEGDCDCKSSLAAAIFHALGYNVVVMLSENIGHAAIGIELKEEWLKELQVDDVDKSVKEYNGKKYLYCETTGDGYRIGQIKDSYSVEDFTTVVEFSC